MSCNRTCSSSSVVFLLVVVAVLIVEMCLKFTPCRGLNFSFRQFLPILYYLAHKGALTFYTCKMTLLYFWVSAEGAFLSLLMVGKGLALFCLLNIGRQNNFFMFA